MYNNNGDDCYGAWFIQERVLMCIDIRIGTFLRLYLSRSLPMIINEKLVVYIF